MQETLGGLAVGYGWPELGCVDGFVVGGSGLGTGCAKESVALSGTGGSGSSSSDESSRGGGKSYRESYGVWGLCCEYTMGR